MRLILFLLFPFLAFSQDSYQDLLQAAEDRYFVLKNLPGNDVVLDPIVTVPPVLEYNATYTNHAKTKYNFNYKPTDKKAFYFVVDTEGELTHPDLQEGYYPEYDRTFTGETQKGNINGHGIHVTGLISSKEEGLCYYYIKNGNLGHAVLKVLRNNGTGSFDQIYACTDYLVKVASELRSKGFEGLFVNFSLGATAESPLMEEMTRRLREAGYIVFAAAGNSGRPPIGTPANTNGANAVTSITETEALSNFSTYGPGAYRASYGDMVRSTDIDNTYTVKRGTSMASPNEMAAAIHGFLQGYDPEDPANTRDIGPEGYDIYFGQGITSYTYTEPGPPQTDTSYTLSIPLTNDYRVVWGNSFFDNQSITITRLDITLTCTEVSSAACIKRLIYFSDTFFKNRGIVVRPGDDLDEVGPIVKHFYEMFAEREDIEIDVNSMTYISQDNLPITTTRSLFNSLSELEHGLIIYETK